MKKCIRKSIRIDRETQLILVKLCRKLELSEAKVFILAVIELGRINDIT